MVSGVGGMAHGRVHMRLARRKGGEGRASPLRSPLSARVLTVIPTSGGFTNVNVLRGFLKTRC